MQHGHTTEIKYRRKEFNQFNTKQSYTVLCVSISHQGKKLQCHHDLQWSAPAWCMGEFLNQGNLQGNQESHQKLTACATVAAGTQAGPEARAAKPPTHMKESLRECHQQGGQREHGMYRKGAEALPA